MHGNWENCKALTHRIGGRAHAHAYRYPCFTTDSRTVSHSYRKHTFSVPVFRALPWPVVDACYIDVCILFICQFEGCFYPLFFALCRVCVYVIIVSFCILLQDLPRLNWYSREQFALGVLFVVAAATRRRRLFLLWAAASLYVPVCICQLHTHIFGVAKSGLGRERDTRQITRTLGRRVQIKLAHTFNSNNTIANDLQHAVNHRMKS